ncbi:hypothetical protein K503DRAFT_804941 [Rhizopogon vinicolor AM-OR11-026]|uniref:Uncharacterized protein n=1 Tax=Rhizopogon vinicolor AM-OR11-026 TaxID=1314800 RepID=A0A1B7MJL7_9AGAM|nr:hypothetical protein K503DRAFT_804941 [Rhizopogon vinicolor AM-OR11-026]
MTPLGNGSTSSLHCQQQSSEHMRIMLEPLTIDNCPCIREVECAAESGHKSALEQQIDSEVDDETRGEEPPSEIWRRVGGEYRESLRVSDELVRTITGFLLGVGKVVKEASACTLNNPGQLHSRTVTLIMRKFPAERPK